MRALRVALLVTVATLGFRAAAQDEAGNRAHRKGDYEKAAEKYREAIGRSGGSMSRRGGSTGTGSGTGPINVRKSNLLIRNLILLRFSPSSVSHLSCLAEQ